jgi:two-component system, chemotaxis family, chemotaxis protein CheY
MPSTSEHANTLRRILVVEDSQVMNAYYRQTLSTVPGYDVSFAADGEKALEHIRTHGAPDLIVLDINMPVMDGLEFLERHKAIWPESPTPIVIVTTEGSEEDCRRGLKSGAQAYLKKPFEVEDLTDLVARWAQRDRIPVTNR